MAGQKRVWLYDWKDHEACYLRGRGTNGAYEEGYEPYPMVDRYFFAMYWAVTTTQAGLMGKPVSVQQYLFSRCVRRV